ncbi:MAG: DUF692 domain-containing protein [Acidimicrobiales bacterium]
MIDLPELGVGITFSSAIEHILDRRPDLVDVVEYEPQTTWLETISDGGGRYQATPGVQQHLDDLPFPKLVHSVGCPIGGSARPDPEQVTLLAETIRSLRSPWASEHLSFNSVGEFSTGFFLPPRQTEGGIESAADSIRSLRSDLGVPLAFETGVNYLRPRTDEMDDGLFAATVAEEADAGIVLDLHNLYANELNGRQPLVEFVDQLALERVWEVHLAGGFWMDDYWLDAHSGPIPDPLLGPTREIVAQLPNLKAIIFEIYPSFVGSAGDRAICAQLELLHELWSTRGSVPPSTARFPAPTIGESQVVPDDWERELGSLVVGRETATELGQELADDPGVALLQRLALEFRASMIATNLRRTTRLLILALGEPVMRMILTEYRNRVTPKMFAGTEARAFAEFLQELDVGVPQLSGVLEFELATLETLLDGQTRIVSFDFDPLPMLLALSEGRLPDGPSQLGDFEIEITADNATTMVA